MLFLRELELWQDCIYKTAMAGKKEEKQHRRLWRKSRTGEDSSETELRRSSKSLSTMREKHRRSKPSQMDIALKVPDFEDYKDLMNDDTAGGPELGKLCVLVCGCVSPYRL